MMGKKIKQKFIYLVERVMGRWGYTQTEGRIYGMLIISENPMTIEELSKETGLSRSSISTSLARLSKDYLVNVKKKGRTKYFSPVPGFLDKFLEQPRELLNKEIVPMMTIGKEIASKTTDRDYAQKIDDFINDLEALECVLKRIMEMEQNSEICMKIKKYK